ncbi:maestro heat-like repeat family member 5 [Zonotrichia albicollis]|uniref:maestro heat-like repeat family member 5 n=1 Tax=Zonotrichia albicollis TaxID=44394 RepID=UPI003D811F07
MAQVTLLESHGCQNGARALCCCRGVALCGSGLLPAGSLSLPCALQVLECLDLRECSDSILELMAQNLQSDNMERRHLALRGLVVLGKNPSMAEKMRSLTERLVELLQENDSDMIRMTILLLRYSLLDNGAPIPTPMALQLAEALLPLFDHEDSQVQLSSMCVFQEMLDSLTNDGRKALKSHVHHSLLPLYFHCHDENQIVAQASCVVLHSAARFLKRRYLEQMPEVDQTWRFGKSLLAEDRSRAAEHLRRALLYLRSPQERLREAAVRFMGMAGRHLRGQQQELQLICTALEPLTEDMSGAMSELAIQTLHVLRATASGRCSIFQRLHDRLRRARMAWPRLPRLRWLHCWSSQES